MFPLSCDHSIHFWHKCIYHSLYVPHICTDVTATADQHCLYIGIQLGRSLFHICKTTETWQLPGLIVIHGTSIAMKETTIYLEYPTTTIAMHDGRGQLRTKGVTFMAVRTESMTIATTSIWRESRSIRDWRIRRRLLFSRRIWEHCRVLFLFM